MAHESTHFGFRDVPHEQKQRLVGEVFSSVAHRYDLMNDVMSAGMHRLWKDRFVKQVRANPSSSTVDLAGGTGDIAVRLHHHTGADVTVMDINPDMLKVGCARQFDRGEWKALRWIAANAQHLPVPDRSLDVITIAFGLRNVTDIQQALHEAYRALKIGGTFLCLEFSHVATPLVKKIYDQYSFHVIPAMGQRIANDRASYQYLVESIRTFPKQESLCQMMQHAGFERVTYKNLSLGVVAIHQGWRI